MSVRAKLAPAASGAIDGVSRVVGRAQTALTCRSAGAGPLVVLDIDNTIADTWPTLQRAWSSERARLAALPVLGGMKVVAHDAPLADGSRVIFLSHRRLWQWPVTFSWLRRNGFDARLTNVVLVASPSEKLGHLRRCAAGREVTYWDDLSHGHESGAVEFYTDVIAEVERLGVEYHGYDEILAISGR